jgi:hypothetical protein
VSNGFSIHVSEAAASQDLFDPWAGPLASQQPLTPKPLTIRIKQTYSPYSEALLLENLLCL